MGEKYYTLSLRPLAPYFFGGERNFQYGTSGQQAVENPYFIESELVPSQSTLFGLTRYLGIAEKKEDYSIDADIIGPESFKMEDEGQQFGKIHSISGLWIERKKQGETEYFMPVPFDHISEMKEQYKPMTYDRNVFYTTEGEMLFPKEYKAKEGISHAYMSIKDGNLIQKEEIFKPDVQTKNRKNRDQEAFFKKKYWRLNRGFSFAFVICVEEDFPAITDSLVYMGREKSPFALKVSEGNLPQMQMNVELFESGDDRFVKRVALSDCYIPEKELFALCLLSYTEEKNHREFYTNYEKSRQVSHLRRFNKREYLYHLICQGSVFLVRKEHIERFDTLVNNVHRQTSGYNRMNGGE